MEKTDSLKQKLRHTLRLDRAMRFVWQAGPGWTIASLALVFIQGALPLLTLYLMKLIVDGVIFALGAPDRLAEFRHVALLIGIAAAVALLNLLFQLIAGLVREAQSLNVTDHMYDILHAKSVEVDLEYYENPTYFDTLHRAQQEGPYRPTHILDGLVGLGRSGISMLAMVGLLFSFHWAVAVILFMAAIPGIFVRLRYSGKMYRWERERTPVERRTSYFNWILTGDTHAKEIRLFDLGNLFIRRFSDLRKKLRHERLKITRKRSVADLAAQTGGMLAVFCSFAFIAYRTVQGAITLGDMVMYYQAFQRGLGYLREFLGGLAALYEDNLFLFNLYEFLDLKPKVKEPLHPQLVPRPMHKGIVFDHVGFKYPTGNRDVLKDISMSIDSGEVVALVGENGSGKTTLIKLLCRLYDPLDGAITLDGIDLREFETTALRREISVIFQDYAHYHLTARENIWFGNIALPPEHKRVNEAADYSGADEVITCLPKGYETILGKWFEEGEELSIGEWQKVALARAFLRDAQIIVLDEPTSAMDAKSEYEVFRRFRQLLDGRSAVLISHRFSTVRMADRIYMLEHGRIIESGTHEQLVKTGGKYSRLFEKQARYYR
ncbi:MAG: ABC transporter ATP-binding protein [Deltaproteobacteria bacterium]|nr:ABC transporter ATP-binding protein [Deltaproteobacteria bacterium]MBW1737203.1 ABC transporter ATP-binding protein [Deltaproteobacteria bacterium]MBW1910457.1 ABC transporter ATP-binding protein [Deltaproteobacteria bacterium]MBW2034217.1 ABC transporter ATP-binding protein [Deltaproteobacteria bacterium]MBW2114848.1 ABC transporter ATP-binding protein [Deltaproteobacteria bacterium]